MNERQPYEQHLAEKMQQLPPPMEPEKAWDKMKVLLDRELPCSNGSSGNGRWWIIGMIAGILLTGTWIFTQRSDPGNDTAAKKPTAVDKTPNASQADQESIAKLPPMQYPPGNDRSNNVTGDKTSELLSGDDAGISQANPATRHAAGEAPPQRNRSSRSNADAARTDQPIVSARRQTIPDDQSSADPVITDDDVGKIIRPQTTISRNNKLPAYPENSTLQSRSGKDKTGKKTNPSSGSGISGTNVQGKPNSTSSLKEAALTSSLPEDIQPDNLSIQTDQLLRGQQMNGRYVNQHSLIDQQVTLEKKKAMRKVTRSKERSFAFGLSLPLAFPVADQKALGYNYRGGSNTVSDYFPSPHVQYHVNRRTYFQGEIQVVTPQYIRPILMYQEKIMANPNIWMYNSVYARKLYYFNLPVSVYHSPLPNFFLGTGLQFSSLMSGVAMYENKKVYGNQETILSQQFGRMNYDSLTNRMSSSEIRLLLDVNYYWQRFTVGLRYNQAFGNYTSFRLNNTTGYTYDKNKALFFYLRYNIWEDKKRSAPASTMLSLK